MASSEPAAVFLDRDGTLIVEKDYLSDPDAVELEAGVIDALQLLRRCGHRLIVLSNQSGIGRGLFSLQDAQRVNRRVEELLRPFGIDFLGWYVCPHVPSDGCDCRKPRSGLAVAAASDLHVRLEGSFVIGDKQSDLELAEVIGGQGILVKTGYGALSAEWALQHMRPVFEGLRGAAEFIVRRQRSAA